MKVIHWIALILVIVAAINSGIWGIFQIDVIAFFFEGSSSAVSRIIFTLFGLAGIWMFYFFKILASCSLSKKGRR